jgi:phospholipid transport system substrate-binding protein
VGARWPERERAGAVEPAASSGSQQEINTMLMKRIVTVVGTVLALLAAPVLRAETAPDALIQRVSGEVIEAVKADKAIQAGDVKRINALVDDKVMPHVNFERMTSMAMGRYWRQATPEQKQRLQEEFKTLLVRTYSGALTQVKDQTVQLKPMRSRPQDTEVIVRTEVRGSGEPIQLDYRLEKAGDAWRIYDVNVLGVWLVEQYRNSFAREIGAKGIDGLIASLAEKNKSASKS